MLPEIQHALRCSALVIILHAILTSEQDTALPGVMSSIGDYQGIDGDGSFVGDVTQLLQTAYSLEMTVQH